MVLAITEISVEYGTDFEDVPLPDEVEVTLDDQSTMDVGVDWLEGDYDGDTAGTYTLEGELVLPEGVINPDELTASVDVLVRPEDGNVFNIDKDEWYADISSAVDGADPDDTLLVYPGTYDGFHVPNGLDNLVLLGANAGVSAGVDAGERGPESVIEGNITTGSGGSEWSDGLTVDGFTIKADRAFNGLRTQGEIVIANNIIDGLNPDLTGSGNFVISFVDFMTYQVFVKDNLIKDARIAFTDNSASLVGGEISGNVIENTLKAIEIGPGLDKIEGNVIRDSGELGLRFFASSDITAVTGNHFADNPIHVWDQRDPHNLEDIYTNNTFEPESLIVGDKIIPEDELVGYEYYSESITLDDGNDL